MSTACGALLLALALISLRVALLPWLPVPIPAVHDEFSYLLGADTLRLGRLANPSHPFWPFFDTIQVLARPTYASKYQPGQAAALALGAMLAGDPYWGVVGSCALLAGLLFWAVRAWTSSRAAWWGAGGFALILLAGHDWLHSYWGGAVAACGMALAAGAFGRLRGESHAKWGFCFGLGCGVLLFTRPFEGALGPAVFALGLLVLRRWKALAAATLVVALFAGLQLRYNRAVTGDPFLLPYALHEQQYAATPVFWVLPLPREAKTYSAAVLKEQHESYERAYWQEQRRDGIAVGLAVHALAVVVMLLGLVGPAWLLALSRNWLTAALLVSAAGLLLDKWLFSHYAAPAAVLALIAGAVAAEGTGKRGRAARIALLAAPVVLAALQIPRVLSGPPRFAVERAAIARQLAARPGRHVVFVRYAPGHRVQEEWVYNGADLDASRILWARDRGGQNRLLLRHAPYRSCWHLLVGATAGRLESCPLD